MSARHPVRDTSTGGVMLSSLLPGVRQIRAPLAAGFLWLVALWILFEPYWPESGDEGVVGSVNRLLDVLSAIGQGIVISFLAYLLGTFSVFLFWRPLMWVIRTQRPNGGRILRSLSQQGRLSLDQVAIDGRKQLEEALRLSGIDVQRVLELTRSAKDRWPRPGPAEHYDREEHGPTVYSPPRLEDADEAEIADRVLHDLPVVANAQLLGKDPEVYSAVDRGEAEVEFRIALIPGLLAFAVSLSITLWPAEPVPAVASTGVGLVASLALLFDAAKRRRDVNELVLSLMEHGRITPPSLSRAKSVAVAEADQAPPSAIKRKSRGTSRLIRDSIAGVKLFTERAIRTYLAELGNMSDTGLMGQFTVARRSAEEARGEADRFERLLREVSPGAGPRRTANEVVECLDRALGLWQGFLDALTDVGGEGKSRLPDADERIAEIERHTAEARERLAEWERGVLDVVDRLASEAKHKAAADRATEGREADAAGTPD